VVELRYFDGLSVEETAEVLGATPVRVKRDWKWAKAWLYGVLSRKQDNPSSERGGMGKSPQFEPLLPAAPSCCSSSSGLQGGCIQL